jgi:hypothetical protein
MKVLLLIILFSNSITFCYTQSDSVPTWIGKAALTNQFELIKAPIKSKRNAILTVTGAGLTIGSIFLLDEEIQRNTNSFTADNTDFKRVFEYITYGGNLESVVGITAGSYFYGKLSKNKKWERTGELLGIGMINTAIVTYAFKWGFARQRPYVSGKDDWHFFEIDEDRASFFSGHSSASFTLASIFALQNQDRTWVKWVAYGSATAISLSRIVIDKHWTSDVLLGAAVGYGIGHFTYNAFKNRDFYILPFRTTTNETGLSLTLVF